MKKRLSALVAALALAAALVMMSAPVASAAATVSTFDSVTLQPKTDFSPDETVLIMGSGFPALTSIDMKVTRPDGSMVKGDGSFTPGFDTVTTDSSGNLSYQYVLDGIEGTYLVDAVESFSGLVLASSSFTDSKYHLEGKPATGDWTSGKLTGWLEGQWVPYRLKVSVISRDIINGGGSFTSSFGVQHDHALSGVLGIDEAANFTIVDANDVPVSGATWISTGSQIVPVSNGDMIEYDGIFTAIAANTYYLRWDAHLATGSSQWPGASLHSHTTASGNQDVPIDVPGALPGDTSPPSNPTSLVATAASSSQIDLSWTASTDNVGVTGYNVERSPNGTSGWTVVGTSTTNSYSDTGLNSATTYYYRVNAFDAAGNTSGYSNTASATTLAVPDTEAPSGSVDINSGATYTNSTSVTLALSASDNVGVTEMMISNDPTFTGAVWEPYATSASWTLTGGADGTRTVYVKFRDAAFNESAVVSDDIILDATPPTIYDTSSSPATLPPAGTPIIITTHVTDNYEVASVYLNYVTTSYDITIPMVNIGGDTYQATIPGTDVGTETIEYIIKAYDGAGNLRTSGFYTISVDNPPSVTIDNPADASTVSGTVNVTATATDDVGVSKVEFYIDDVLKATDTTAPYEYSWDTTLETNTSHSVKAIAYDTINQTGQDVNNVTVSNIIDTQPPTIPVWQSVVPGNGSADLLWYPSTDNVAVGGYEVRYTTDPTGLWTVVDVGNVTSYQILGLTNGTTYYVQVQAYDMASPRNLSGWNDQRAVTPNEPGAMVIGYNGDWRVGTDSGHSAGATMVSNSVGSYALVTFKGTAITWIGSRWSNRGIAKVTVDSEAPVYLDLYAPGWETQVTFLTRNWGSLGTHTLKIEVSGQKRSNATDYYASVDAFVVSTGTSTVRYEEGALSYTGSWITSLDSSHSGGGHKASKDYTTPARASFTFAGTGVKLFGAKYTNRGKAKIWVDSDTPQVVELYSPTWQAQQLVFFKDLPDGTHTLNVEVTNQKNPSATDYYVSVDSLDVTTGSGTVVKYEELTSSSSRSEENGATYAGTWWMGYDYTHSGGSHKVSNVSGSTASYRFYGTGITWSGAKYTNRGKANVTIFDTANPANVKATATVDLYSSSWQPTTVIYTKFDLPEGDYTLKIEVAGTKSSAATDYYVSIDFFDVFFDTTSPSTPTNLAATTVGSTQINLGWTASADDVKVVGYEVERSPNGSTGWTLIGTAPNTTYSSTGLTSGTTYFYRVRAYDVRGNKSDYSNVAFATTL